MYRSMGTAKQNLYDNKFEMMITIEKKWELARVENQPHLVTIKNRHTDTTIEVFTFYKTVNAVSAKYEQVKCKGVINSRTWSKEYFFRRLIKDIMSLHKHNIHRYLHFTSKDDAILEPLIDNGFKIAVIENLLNPDDITYTGVLNLHKLKSKY